MRATTTFNLAPGTTLNANIAPVSSTSVTLYLGLGALLVLVAVAGLGLPRLLRRRQLGEPPLESRKGDRELLVEEIAALDQAHEAGTVAHDDYALQREELKARLLKLVEARGTRDLT